MIKINKTIINNLAIVSLAEDFQAEDGKEFRQAIEQEIDKGYKSLIVDMTDLVYLDTPAIVSILSVRNYINEIGGEIRFVEPKDNRVKRLFTTTRLNQILDFYPDTQKAIEGSRKRERREVYKEDILHNFLIVRSPKGRAEAFIEEVKKIREYLSLKEIYPPQQAYNEALIEIEYCGLNNLDLLIIEGKRPGPKNFPHILGSEFVGKIVQTGEKVAVYPWTYCGKCEQCKKTQSAVAGDAPKVQEFAYKLDEDIKGAVDVVKDYRLSLSQRDDIDED